MIISQLSESLVKYRSSRRYMNVLKYLRKLYEYIGEGGATRSCGAKRFFCHIRKTKNGKKLLLGQQLQLTIK